MAQAVWSVWIDDIQYIGIFRVSMESFVCCERKQWLLLYDYLLKLAYFESFAYLVSLAAPFVSMRITSRWLFGGRLFFIGWPADRVSGEWKKGRCGVIGWHPGFCWWSKRGVCSF